MSHLFACSIGPVQDFIATARRSRDLWYGSWLLSELSKAAAKSITVNGGQLIFPASDNVSDLAPKSNFNAPNKVVAVLIDSPVKTAQEVDRAIKQRMTELRDDAFKSPQSHPLFDQTMAEAQVEDLVEFYWSSVEFDGDDAYARARGLAESLLAARKTTRDFGPTKGDYLPKSSLDGVRESVINENAYPALNASAAETECRVKVLFDRFGARPAERLSGVDILKRLGERGNSATSFPSTSHMAALPFLKQIDEDRNTEDSSHLLSAIGKLLEEENISNDETDGALVFSSRLAEWIPDQAQRRRIDKKIDTLLQQYAGNSRPQPYFALLIADGDNMGVTIDHLSLQQNPIQKHREMSLALSQFAGDVHRIVQANEGVLVYSGGDDVMAYLPLYSVLKCAGQLADRFGKAMAPFKTVNGVSPTLSTGIVVAHHLEPLSDTLDLARQAEKTAKTVNGKEGLAITVSKRSGVDRTVKGKRYILAKRLARMIEWQSTGAISAGTAYELADLHRVLGQSDQLQAALISEALRVIDRKHESGGESKVSDQVAKYLVRWIKSDKISLHDLAHELIIAAMFAGVSNMAENELEEEEQTP